MPPLVTGMHSLEDLKQVTGTITQQDPAVLLAVFRREAGIHNANLDAMTVGLATKTTDVEVQYGGTTSGRWQQVGDAARARTQKGGTPAFFQLPLDKFEIATGWTDDFALRNSPADLAKDFEGFLGSHAQLLQTRIKQALFGATNYTLVDDQGQRAVLGKTLNVKRLLNADGALIPVNRNGQSFDGTTHTHYSWLNGTAPTDAFVQAVISNVIEHDQGSEVVININAADVSKWVALTGYSALVVPAAQYVGPGQSDTRLDITRTDNRQVGFYNGYPVWSRTWVPAGYFHVYDNGSPKPLKIRELYDGSSGVQLAGEIKLVPFTVEYFRSFFGVGVENRANSAVGYYASGASAYVDPTFTY